MIVIRSLIFNLVFYLNLILFLVLGVPFFFTPRKWSIAALKLWAKVSLWWLRLICGTKIEVIGLQHVPKGAVLIAGKHQSLWETFAILPLLADPCMVLKRELTFIPFFGWFIYKFRMIAVARGSGSVALRGLMSRAKVEAANGRQIVIFPEGTRREPGAAPAYRPGAAALYSALQLACVPFGLNAGLYWPRRKFLRYPGVITIEFGQPIASGQPRKIFEAELQRAIETITNRLIENVNRTNT